MVFPEGIATSSPVRGFLPTPRLRGFTTNTPKPLSSILSPRVRASFIDWKRASTACSAFIFGTPVLSATRLIMSNFITAWWPFSVWGTDASGLQMQVRMIDTGGKDCQGTRFIREFNVVWLWYLNFAEKEMARVSRKSGASRQNKAP